MKFLSTLLLVAGAGVAAAFAPTFGRPSLATKAYMLDPDFVHQVAQQGVDAVRVIVQECDNQECVNVEGLKGTDGMWHFSQGLPEGRETTSRILMWHLDENE